MMVLDGCFIIEHLINIAIGREEPSLHATPFGPTQLSVDLILAENQIPFFVLVDLIAATKLREFESTESPPPVLLVKLVVFYLAGEKGRDMSWELLSAEGISHILHLLHAMVTTARTSWELPPPITHNYGAVLEMAQEAVRLLRRIPLLVLVPLLLNLMAFEQSAPAQLQDVSAAYVSSMAKLVQSAEDVGVLMAAEVLQQHGAAGSKEEVVRFFRTLGEAAAGERKQEAASFLWPVGTVSEAAAGGKLETSYLSVMLKKLRKRSRQPLFNRNVWADVQRNYFTLLAELVALVTFFSSVSTIVQTYASFKYR